jgi:hypothetical protein
MLGGQEACRTRGDPLFLPERLAFGAMPVSAGIVGWVLVSAMGAHVEMASNFRRPTKLDGRKHSALRGAQVYSSFELGSMSADDVG